MNLRSPTGIMLRQQQQQQQQDFIKRSLLQVISAAALAFLLVTTSANAASDRQSLRSKSSRVSAVEQQRTQQAFVTLLYGDKFVLGVRVLGQSLKMTGTSKDMVVLVSKGVTEEAAQLLQADGWIVDRVELLNNPNSHHPSNFWGVYTKLKIFNLTQYEKLIYLDADTIVVNDIEDLFLCQGFCACLRHSEKFNTGVMVVEPSAQVFADMMQKIESTPSYTGGDQGFLNEYFADFVNAKLFDSKQSFAERRKEPIPKMERLPTVYNADVGLFMLANKWMVDESLLKVMHYTLGPLKPWDWWTAWLVIPVSHWQRLRNALPASIPGAGGGANPALGSYIWLLVLLPLGTMALLYRQMVKEASSDLPIFGQNLNKGRKGKASPTPIPEYFVTASVVAFFVIGVCSLGIAFSLVPRQVRPWTGVLLVYEWVLFLFCLMYGGFLSLVRYWGRTSSTHIVVDKEGSDSKYTGPAKGHVRGSIRWDGETALYGLAMAVIVVVVPGLPYMLGVTALFARFGMFVGGGVAMAIFTTVVSQHLATRWYLLGREDHSQLHSHSLYL